jgi:hypothetical protein
MAAKNKKYLLLAIILFGLTSFLSAQTAGYFIEEDGDELKIFQRFVWKGGEYTLQYEVVFEREINGAYRTHLKEFTSSNFIEVSLPPGAYRFRVIPYNILGKPVEGSKWVYIDVLPVSQQEKNEESEPEPEIVIEQETKQEPVLENEPESEPEEEPEPARSDSLRRVLFGLGVSLGYSFPVYGNNNSDFTSLGNFGWRVNIAFRTSQDVYIGPEFFGYIYRYNLPEIPDISLSTIGLNFLFRKWLLNERFAVSFRIGSSIPINSSIVPQNDSQYFIIEEDLPIGGLILNIGPSLCLRIGKHLLLEAGLEFMQMINVDFGGYINPVLGINFQF